MRIKIGPIPESPEMPPGNWTPLREFGPAVMQLFALPLGAVAGALVVLLWLVATPVRDEPYVSLLLLGGAVLLLSPIHELVHAAIHPGFGISSRSVIGAWPARLLFYAHYDGVISRSRFIAILATPMLVITVLPLLICAVTQHGSVTLAFVSALNAIGAGGDMFGIILLLAQVPRGAKVFNRGWRTFWRD